MSSQLTAFSFRARASRVEVALFVVLMLVAAGLRVAGLTGAPPGFSDSEIADLRIVDQVRIGQVTVFYDIGDEAGSREGLYYPLLSVFTGLLGGGLYGYRLFGVLANLLALAFVYGFARRLFGATVALSALAALAVAFWPVFTARAVARETLLPLFTAGAVYFFVRGFTTRPTDAGDPMPAMRLVAGGVLMGLALYVHWTAVFLVVAFLLFGFYANARYPRLARRGWGDVGFALLVVLIVAVPFIVSLLRTPGVSALSAYLLHAFEALPESALDTVAALFWRGDADPTRNLPGLPLFGPVAAVAFALGVVVSVRRYRRPAYALVLIGLLMGLLPDALSVGATDFRRLVSAMPVLYVAVGIGVDAALRYVMRRRKALLALGLAAAVIVVAAAGLTAYNLGAWSLRDDVFERYHANLGRLAVHLDATAAHIPTTVCSPALRRVNGTHLTDRQLLRYMLHQSALPIRYTDCFSSVVLAAGGARQQITFTYGDGPAQVPEPLQSWFTNAEETPIYGLPAGSAVVIEVAQPLGDLMGSFITTAPAGYAPEAPGGPGPASIPVRLGGNLTFEGYAVGAAEVQPGDAVELVTYWRVDGPTPPDLNMFTHLLFDPDGAPVAQADLLGPIAATLRPSDIFAQVHYLSLPARLLPDDYNLVIGVVDASGGRLPVLDDGAERGTRLFLQQIHVTDGGGEGDG